nr:THAP domain-containing protein 2-like [Vanessa tameamea]
MVITCCVRGCRSENYPGSGISFHAFPHNSHIRKQWIKAVKRENWKPSQHSRICSKHFPQEYFIAGRKRSMLHKDAIPTSFTCNTHIEKVMSPESRFGISPDRSSFPDPDHITTIIERKKTTLKNNRPSKRPIFIIKSPSNITMLDGKLAKIFLKQKDMSKKLLQRLRSSRQLCKTLRNKVMLLEDEIKQLKNKTVNNSTPLILTLSNDMYEKETLTIRVARSE